MATCTLEKWAGIVVGAGLLLACGTQGPPQPPRIEKPARVADLAVTQVGRTLTLSFTLPVLAADGERLSKPLEIHILRTLASPGQKPAEVASTGQPWVALLPGDLPGYARGQKIEYPIALSEQEFTQQVGSTFAFRVRGLTRGFRHRPITGELSNQVEVGLLDVAGPVEGLEVKVAEHALEPAWTRPTRSLTGHPVANLAGYRVYKSKTGEPDSFLLLGETVAETYQDPDFAFKSAYSYKVRAVFKQDGQVAESEDSEVRKVIPLDTFPPAAPTGLTGLFTAAQVELIWTANTEPDLAGYNVCRRDNRGQALRINHELLGTPIFRDTAVGRGQKYAYWVTAVDLAGNESKPSAEVEVQTQ